jgi:hypothetical protein
MDRPIGWAVRGTWRPPAPSLVREGSLPAAAREIVATRVGRPKLSYLARTNETPLLVRIRIFRGYGFWRIAMFTLVP